MFSRRFNSIIFSTDLKYTYARINKNGLGFFIISSNPAITNLHNISTVT